TFSPGPKPIATHGAGDLRSSNFFRMKIAVADDMLPYSAKTSRDAQTRSSDRPSVAAAASRIFGPPGWIAHDLMSGTFNPRVASHSSSHGRRFVAITSGMRFES